MNKNLKNISVILGITSLALCLLGNWYAILVGIIATLVSTVLVKDEETTSKTLQPVILASFVILFNLVFSFIINFIRTCINFSADPDYLALTNLSRFSNVINFIVTIILAFFIVISIIQLARKKDIPVVNKLASKIANISANKSEPVQKVEEEQIEISTPEDKE